MDRAGGRGRDDCGVLRPHPETGGWRALDEVAYRSTFLWTIGASILLEALASGSLPEGERRANSRDRHIGRAGEYAGHWLPVAGAFAAMVMALAEANQFWIANASYLAFKLAAISSSAVNIVA